MSEINAESTTMPPVELRMPRASEREEMLAGKLYNSVDPELNALREKAGDLCARFNAASRTDHAARRDPPTPVRHRPRAAARGTADRGTPALLEPARRRETTRSRPPRGRSKTPLPAGQHPAGADDPTGREGAPVS